MITLDEFIQDNLLGIRYMQRNQYVVEPGFEALYVRYTKRFYNRKWLEPVLDIANVSVEEDKRGTGIFTRLVESLRRNYPTLVLYVECATPRFYQMLLKIGFVPENNSGDCCSCFLLTV